MESAFSESLNSLKGWRDRFEASDVDAIENADITNIHMDGDQLLINFTTGHTLRLSDDGQSCCEHRYMNTDDDLSYYIGSRLTGFRVQEGADDEGEYGDVTESMFLLIDTTKGTFTIANYNSHNGYYGGISVRARLDRPGGGTW